MINKSTQKLETEEGYRELGITVFRYNSKL